jgi:hypothetical protein
VEARIGAGGGGVVRAAYSARTSGAGLGYMSSWSRGVCGALTSAAGLGVSRDRARVSRGWGGGV